MPTLAAEDGAGHAAGRRAQGESQQLGARRIDAHGGRHVLVFAYRHPLPTGARIVQANRNEEADEAGDQNDVIKLLRVLELSSEEYRFGDRLDALGTA